LATPVLWVEIGDDLLMAFDDALVRKRVFSPDSARIPIGVSGGVVAIRETDFWQIVKEWMQ
jgi:hypothetical protein